MRFVFATALAVLTITIAAAQTVGPAAAQQKKAVAQKKPVPKIVFKKSRNQCTTLAYQRGFADSDMGGASGFIWMCMQGKQQ